MTPDVNECSYSGASTSTLKLDAMPAVVRLDVWRPTGQPMRIEPADYDDPDGRGPTPDVTWLELIEAAVFAAFDRCGFSVEEIEQAAARGMARCHRLSSAIEEINRKSAAMEGTTR
jgi:hypothetical protein